jgi:hypothetical protein
VNLKPNRSDLGWIYFLGKEKKNGLKLLGRDRFVPGSAQIGIHTRGMQQLSTAQAGQPAMQGWAACPLHALARCG